MLRKLIQTNPLLYRIWFNLIRKSKTTATLPDKKDYFYFGGFPRSGNSYLTNLIKELHPKVPFSHHLHTIAAIKIALNEKIPVVIIVRHPLECIASLQVMNQKDQDEINKPLLERYISEYIHYHAFVLKHKQDLEIVVFEKTIKSPDEFLTTLYEVSDPKIDPVKTEELSVERLSEKTTIGEKQKKMDKEHAVRFSSLPNKERTKLKEGIKAVLMELEDLQTCIALYDQLKATN
jgi:hypothetical protein